MDIDLFFISFFVAMGIVMGTFSITQLGYQHRVGGAKMFLRSVLAFIKGFFGWPILFPIGLMEGKYRMNVFHKIANPNFKD